MKLSDKWFRNCPQVGLLADNTKQNMQKILGYTEGGVYKRIDENRELLELLQRDTPEFMASHPWVRGWLASQDEFLAALVSSVPITQGLFLEQAQQHPDQFPRPWPVGADKMVDDGVDIESACQVLNITPEQAQQIQSIIRSAEANNSQA